MSEMVLTTEGDRYVVVTRRFAASPELLYRAHTQPALIQKWLLGPDGWTMPVCMSEARPGGRIRYEWKDGKGSGFHLTASTWSWLRLARLSVSNGCTCQSRRRIITSKHGSMQTVQGR